jgi:hypothetical protein
MHAFQLIRELSLFHVQQFVASLRIKAAVCFRWQVQVSVE